MKRIASISILAVTGGLAFWLSQSLDRACGRGDAQIEIRAATIMEQGIRAVRAARERAGAVLDASIDPNRTGLIGPEVSPLVTTVGELEAKRTTTNPNMAALLVSLLDEAGVRRGDTVAIGSSGSFPALLLASLAAAKSMGVQPLVILSLGASSFGATDPDFNLLDLYNLLRSEHICSGAPAAVSLGGDKDTGSDFDAAVRERLIRRIAADSVAFLTEPDLDRNAAERMRIYRDNARGRLAAFINSGGSSANIGTSRLVLGVRPGLNTQMRLPQAAERGVMFDMAARGIPVIHLLYIKGLVQQASLPWDPIPLPRPEALNAASGSHRGAFWFVSMAYLALLVMLVPRRRVVDKTLDSRPTDH